MTDPWTPPTEAEQEELLRWLNEEVRPVARQRHLERDEEDHQ